MNTDALRRARGALYYLLLKSRFNFTFPKTKHLICKTIFKCYSIRSLDIMHVHIDVEISTEKKELKKSGDFAEKPYLKGTKAFEVHLLF